MKPSWELDFAQSRKNAQKNIGAPLELLQPMVHLFHLYLRDCAAAARGDVDHAVAIAFRQTLEFTDAVDILLRHQAIVPAAAQARSALEAAAQVAYLVKTGDPALANAYMFAEVIRMEQELDRKIEALEGQDVDEMMVLRAELRAKLEGESSKSGAVGVAASAIRELHPGKPWYSILNGPATCTRCWNGANWNLCRCSTAT